MKEIPYAAFSEKAHDKGSSAQPLLSCQFELTFRCGLLCQHCYTRCYNTPALAAKELSLSKVKRILDKLRKAGVLWLCLTGGDPLARRDFFQIYAYAKKKGFLITIFTSAAQITAKTFSLLKRNPPFLVEITLNALDEALYERISGVKGSFGRVIKNISRLRKAQVPLKIKVQVTKSNLGQVAGIKAFAARQGFLFEAGYDLYPSLDGDVAVCSLRPARGQVIRFQERYGRDMSCMNAGQEQLRGPGNVFFCSVGSAKSLYIDPFGRAFLCPLIRDTDFDLQRMSVRRALEKLRPLFSDRRYSTKSECRSCRLWAYCPRCPGEAYLETGDIEAPIPYYCGLTKSFFLARSKSG